MTAPQCFYTYGDTDEPDVSEQTKPLWAAIYELRARLDRSDAELRARDLDAEADEHERDAKEAMEAVKEALADNDREGAGMMIRLKNDCWERAGTKRTEAAALRARHGIERS
jgi:hypothetical protein